MKIVIFLLGLMMVLMSHPMSMVILVMGIVFIYSFSIYLMIGSYLFGVVLMLIMLSGMMVVFSYMASLSPNEKFEISMMGVILVMLGGVGESVELSCLSYGVSKMWDSLVLMMNEFMVSYLLVIMVMTVWISGWWSGPIRSFEENNS